MQRPYVKLQTPNRSDDLYKHLDAVLPKLRALPGVVGITLNGGMSRGYADHLSEIDITVYLESETYRIWQGGKSPIPWGIAMMEGSLFDVSVVEFNSEKERHWESDTIWDASYAKVLYDPNGLVSQLFQEKLADFHQPDDAEANLFNCWWNFRLAGDSWVYRGDILQGHHVLNKAVLFLIRALFIVNDELIPHEKWLIHMSRSLKWTPGRWGDGLRDSMSTGDMGVSSLVGRQAAIETLWEEIDTYAKRKHPDLPVQMMQKTFYQLMRWLVEEGSVPITAWKSKASVEILNRDPFHGIVDIEGDMIVLNHDRLLNVKPAEMYSWHYEILSKSAPREPDQDVEPKNRGGS